MLTFLDFFISSFSQLLSSPSFTLMANKSVHAALNHCEPSPSPSDSSQDDGQSLWAGAAIERHLRHVELESSLRASLLKSSSPNHLTIPHSRKKGFISTPPVPANSPFLTPSNSFPHISLLQNSEDIVASIGFPRVHSAYPSSVPSSPSTPTFDPSLASDTSDCPDEETEGFYPSDSASFSFGHGILSAEDVPKGFGLGITGVSKHDGNGQFDGIGLVSIHRWIPRTTHEANSYVVPLHLSESFPQDDGDLELSDTFLQEVAMTFIQDPFHNHSLATIPECESCSELDPGETCDSVSTVGMGETSHASPVSDQVLTLKEEDAPLRRTKKHFSASTISSELKRTTSVKRTNLGGTRARSSTWPSLK